MSDDNEPLGEDLFDDHDETRPKSTLLKRRNLPARFLVPNLLTVLALCAGLTAIRFSVQGRFEIAVALILAAAVLDGLDGRVARYMKGASKIGAEMDSLADIVNFGVAPALMLYFWGLQDARSLGWLAILVYVVCCLLRLARFNVLSREDSDLPGNDRRFFVGVPSPAGAGLALLPMFIYLAGFEPIAHWSGAIAAHIVIVGLLMISQVPTFSFKTILVPRDQIMFVLIGTVLAVGILLTYPWISMVVIDLAYIVTIGFAVRAKRRINRSLRGKS